MGYFERIKYPDGQISAKHVEDEDWNEYSLTERINSYEDLMYIRAIADIAHNKGFINSIDFFLPCLFGQRSDRRFSEDQSFDLKLITDIINACGFWKVKIFDPHSDVAMALINNSVRVSSFEYVKQTVEDITSQPDYTGDLVLIAPDAGAFKKVFEYGEKLGLPVVGALKHRDKDGKVTLIFSHDVTYKNCLIVDDLCDGGYTFLVLADALRKHGAKTVYLYVSHGLFSKGFGELIKQINHIYCTNSVKDLPDDVFELKFADGGAAGIQTSDFVTQYKII